MASLSERIEAGEKRVRALAKEKPGDDPELHAARLRLFADLSELIRGSEDDDDSLAERLWRVCFLKRIEFFRTRIDSEPQGQAQRQTVQAFRLYIAESMRLIRDLVETVRLKKKVSCRLFTCLGDLARYKESISPETNKRWAEAESLYREAAALWPEAGLPQNQLAVLAYYRHRTLVSAYRYSRALACGKPFENARRNLKNLLIELCDSTRPEASTVHERFFDDFLRLFAFILLPGDPISYERARDICGSFQSRFNEAMHASGLKGEALTALVGLTIFAVTNGDVFSRPIGDSRASALSLDLFRNLVVSISEKCSMEAEGALQSDNRELLSTLSKSLFHLCVVCDFLDAYGLHLLDAPSKRKLEELDRALASVETSNICASFVDVIDDNQEFSGFLPLGNAKRAVPGKFGLEERLVKVRRFVAIIVYNDLKPLSVNGEVYSTHPSGAPYDDDEEEEILIRPTYGARPLDASSLTPSVQWSEPPRYTTAHSQLPTFFPYPGLSYGQPTAWQPSTAFGSSTGASTTSQSVNWGWDAPRRTSTQQPRAPPGFE